MGSIIDIIRAIGALSELVKGIQSLLREQRAKREAEKKLERDRAIDKAEKAESEKEFDDAQKDIVKNKA